MRNNFICYLNGVSSCGKTSISKELLKTFSEPTIYLSLDNVHQNLCDRYNNDEWELYNKECYGLHRSAEVWYKQGFNVILDSVLETKKLYDDAKKVLPTAIFIGVFVSLETLLQREKQRGRNDFKLVKYQYSRVHKGIKYDLEINSEDTTPIDLSQEIISFLD